MKKIWEVLVWAILTPFLTIGGSYGIDLWYHYTLTIQSEHAAMIFVAPLFAVAGAFAGLMFANSKE